MPPKQAAYLLDMLQAARAVQEYLAGYTHDDFLADLKTQDAVLRRLLVLGEAAARVTPEMRAAIPAIPFSSIIGMRNRIVHDYGHIDSEIIWEVTQVHLPLIIPELQRIFHASDEPPRER